MSDPIELTPLERTWDELQRFENRERYMRQSAQTRAGDPAPLPSRDPLAGVDAAFRRVFG